ncbi:TRANSCRIPTION FACTOR MYB51-LIKE ISOFORM X1 [Salix purpurea]|uniref:TRANSCRIPTION FACTOR MYB51-LIKE ISOFORM X1 n=1 Tax=Salix purpurea TaxID=77065 RepID=A0A9Q1ADM8_SALPP|nr:TRANSCRIPTION FACTOR MYB51-LIKE ISOFORM X1 [Salix purpurea]
MADTEHSSSEETSVDSREETSQESKLELSEDEETLVIRMFNLVGERFDALRVNESVEPNKC